MALFCTCVPVGEVQSECTPSELTLVVCPLAGKVEPDSHSISSGVPVPFALMQTECTPSALSHVATNPWPAFHQSLGERQCGR